MHRPLRCSLKISSFRFYRENINIYQSRITISIDFFFSCFGFNENKHKSLVWLRIIGCWGRVIYTEQKHTTHVPQQLPHRTRPSMQQYIWRWLINNSQNHCIPRWIYPVTTWCTNTSSSTKFNHWPRRWAEHIVVDTCFHVHVHVAF